MSRSILDHNTIHMEILGSFPPSGCRDGINDSAYFIIIFFFFGIVAGIVNYSFPGFFSITGQTSQNDSNFSNLTIRVHNRASINMCWRSLVVDNALGEWEVGAPSAIFFFSFFCFSVKQINIFFAKLFSISRYFNLPLGSGKNDFSSQKKIKVRLKNSKRNYPILVKIEFTGEVWLKMNW